jgi:hypothetical protein
MTLSATALSTFTLIAALAGCSSAANSADAESTPEAREQPGVLACQEATDALADFEVLTLDELRERLLAARDAAEGAPEVRDNLTDLAISLRNVMGYANENFARTQFVGSTERTADELREACAQLPVAPVSP